jgi:predicted GNAT superfamily acetyltransferase
MLALNQANLVETSALTLDALEQLVVASFASLVVEDGAGMLIALDQDADYGSPNFLWFRARYERFVYIDRVIVAAAARGRGVARGLYAHLFGAMRAAGHSLAVAEVNLEPPNPGSDAFHAQLGFAEVGRARIHGGAKTVRYLAREIGVA